MVEDNIIQPKQSPKSTAVNMEVNLGGLILQNPVTVGSGTFASGREFASFVDVGSLGAVTTKGVSLNGWNGNDGIRIAETPSGMLNSIGLQNPGINHLLEEDIPWLKSNNATIIVNVSGHSISEYRAVIETCEEKNPPDAYEINISCPNVDKGGMTLGTDPKDSYNVVQACRSATSRPLIVKLTPNVTDITEIASSVEAAGADAVSLINTLLGMAINAKTRKPELGRIVGGLSGPAIKPIALRMVWQVSQCVSIPILGMGGITTGLDAVEFLLAGATAVAVGTANFIDPYASIKVIDGIASYCEEQNVLEVADLIGGLVC